MIKNDRIEALARLARQVRLQSFWCRLTDFDDQGVYASNRFY